MLTFGITPWRGHSGWVSCGADLLVHPPGRQAAHGQPWGHLLREVRREAAAALRGAALPQGATEHALKPRQPLALPCACRGNHVSAPVDVKPHSHLLGSPPGRVHVCSPEGADLLPLPSTRQIERVRASRNRRLYSRGRKPPNSQQCEVRDARSPGGHNMTVQDSDCDTLGEPARRMCTSTDV